MKDPYDPPVPLTLGQIEEAAAWFGTAIRTGSLPKWRTCFKFLDNRRRIADSIERQIRRELAGCWSKTTMFYFDGTLSFHDGTFQRRMSAMPFPSWAFSRGAAGIFSNDGRFHGRVS